MPPARPSILLISPDLMLTSRVAGLVASMAGQLETLSLCTATPKGEAFDLVLIDLGNLRPAPGELLTQLRTTLSRQPLPPIVAFGPHVHKDRLQAAHDAGAHDAVSRGELLGDFASCIARWCDSVEGGSPT